MRRDPSIRPDASCALMVSAARAIRGDQGGAPRLCRQRWSVLALALLVAASAALILSWRGGSPAAP